MMETGTATLVNTKRYPFNNSETTVALQSEQRCTDYFVVAQVADSDGPAGEIRISGKATNGFRIAFCGSATRVCIQYLVIGGGAS